MRFPTEKEIAGTVKNHIKGETVTRIAVALCARGGGDLLGNECGQPKARALCNLDTLDAGCFQEG